MKTSVTNPFSHKPMAEERKRERETFAGKNLETSSAICAPSSTSNSSLSWPQKPARNTKNPAQKQGQNSVEIQPSIGA